MSKRRAVPILVAHLAIPHHPLTLEGIVRALNTFAAYPIACGPLITLFESLPNDSLTKWLAGAAIAQSAHPKHLDKIIQLIRDERHGKSRGSLTLALIRGEPEVVLPLLNELKTDPYIGSSAKQALKLIK